MPLREKGKIILFIFFSFYKAFGQDSLVHTFTGYKNLIQKDFRYYSDSISKKGKKFFVEVFVSEFDTLNKKLRLTLNYSYYNPLYLFNPTHVLNVGGVVFVMRYGKQIDTAIIHRLGFEIITAQEITAIEKLNKQYVEFNNAPSYSSQPFVFELDGGKAEYRWYQTSEDVPKDDRVLDFEYSKSNIKYNLYLKAKLKEYGY